MSDLDPGLSPTSRALLDAAREDLGPDAAAVQRMRAGVAAKVGGGILAGSLAAKLGLAAVVATAAVAAVLYTTREPAAPVEAAPTSAPRSLPVLDTPRPVEPPPVAPPVSSIDLAREVALVDDAMAALAGHDAERALSVIATYAQETRGAGQLAEDAAAIEAEATCALDAAATERALAAFDAKYPHSAQRARIAAACVR